MSKPDSNTWFTSDLHISHSNVIEFDNRPFLNLEHMHGVLIKNYNNCVKPEDVCYFLGDIALGKSEIVKDTISKMNGFKILIQGNHDKGPVAMRRIGFDLVINTASIVVSNRIVTMSHCPLRGVPREDTTNMRDHVEGDNWHGEHKHQRFSVPDFGQYHLHGHLHSRSDNIKQGRQWDVGVTGNGYRPISIGQIEKWIQLNERVANEQT